MAAPQNDQITDLKKQIDDLRAKLSGLEQAQSPLQTSIAVHDKRIDDALSRIGDLNVGVSNYGILFGAIGVLITLILGVGGVLTYLNAGAKAVNEAKKWILDNLKNLKEEADAIKAEMREIQQSVTDMADDVFKSLGDVKNISQHDLMFLKKIAEKSEDIPQSQYKYKDWIAQAFAAYADKKLDDAAFYFGKAAESVESSSEDVAVSLFNRAVVLGELGRHQDEISIYEEIDRRYGSAPDTVLRMQVAKALVNKGVALENLGQHQDEIAVYDEIDRRYGSARDAALRELVANALFNKGVALGKLGQHQDEIALYDDIDYRYGSAPDAALREHVANALVYKGMTLGEQGQHQDEIVLYDEIDRRYGSAPDAALREQVANALVYKGVALGNLGRHQDAIATYDLVINRYGHAPEPGIVEQVGKAMGARAWRLYMTGDFPGFLAGMEQAVQRAPKDGVHLVNLAFAQYLAGLGRDVVLATYGRAWQVMADRAKWDRLVLKDLRQHHLRHQQQPPVPADLIAAVAALAGGT